MKSTNINIKYKIYMYICIDIRLNLSYHIQHIKKRPTKGSIQEPELDPHVNPWTSFPMNAKVSFRMYIYVFRSLSISN